MFSSAKKATLQPFRDRLTRAANACPAWCINKAALAAHGEPATAEEEEALNAWELARDSYELASAWWDQVNLYGNTVTEAMILDFSHVYLLGWNDETGKSYLTSWSGDREVYDFVVVGAGESGPPLWGRQGESGVRLEPMPPGLDHGAQVAHATSRGGVRAFGWYYEEGFDLVENGVDPWGSPRITMVLRTRG